MPGNTSRLDLPYPVGSDTPNGPSQIESLANALDAVVDGWASGIAENLSTAFPSPVLGNRYYATDTEVETTYNGSEWVPSSIINQSSGNIQALPVGSSAAAGSIGLAADAGHVHATPSAAAILGLVYPVGRWLFSGISTNPGTEGYFEEGVSFGTWEAVGAGRVIMGVGEGTDINGNTLTVTEGTSGDDVGEYTHKLAADESGQPGISATTSTESAEHDHTFSGETGTESASHTHPTVASLDNGGYNFAADGGDHTIQETNSGTESTTHTHAYSGTTSTESATHDHTLTVNAAAAADAHNNVMPYEGAYIWQRTA